MADIEDWDVAAANNNSAPPDGAPESTTTIGDTNDIMREIMAVIARWYQDTDGAQATTGSSNAYVFASNRSISAHYDGQITVFDANHTNTGAATLKADGTNNAAIKKYVGQAIAALSAGDIVSGGKYITIFDGTQHILINPSSTVSDYEEGTFTPSFDDASSGGNSSATTLTGRYTKIGRIVHINITGANIDTTGLTAGNDAFITGLPFTSVGAVHVGTVRVQSTSFNGNICASIPAASTYLTFSEMATGAALDNITVAEFSDDAADIIVNMAYEAT